MSSVPIKSGPEPLHSRSATSSPLRGNSTHSNLKQPTHADTVEKTNEIVFSVFMMVLMVIIICGIYCGRNCH